MNEKRKARARHITKVEARRRVYAWAANQLASVQHDHPLYRDPSSGEHLSERDAACVFATLCELIYELRARSANLKEG